MDNYGLDGNTLGKPGEVGSMHSEKGFERWGCQGSGERKDLMRRSCYAFNLPLIQIRESLYVGGFLMCYSTAKNTPVMCTRGREKGLAFPEGYNDS